MLHIMSLHIMSCHLRFAWDIADFVVNGKRPKKTREIMDSQYKLIYQCWCEEPKDRLKVEDIIALVETEMKKMDHNFN